MANSPAAGITTGTLDIVITGDTVILMITAKSWITRIGRTEIAIITIERCPRSTLPAATDFFTIAEVGILAIEINLAAAIVAQSDALPFAKLFPSWALASAVCRITVHAGAQTLDLQSGTCPIAANIPLSTAIVIITKIMIRRIDAHPALTRIRRARIAVITIIIMTAITVVRSLAVIAGGTKNLPRGAFTHAIGRTAISVSKVAVIALLSRIKNAITARGFNGAKSGASVTAGQVSIIALLTAIQVSVPAFR